jgi:hypothetical protein
MDAASPTKMNALVLTVINTTDLLSIWHSRLVPTSFQPPGQYVADMTLFSVIQLQGQCALDVTFVRVEPLIVTVD